MRVRVSFLDLLFHYGAGRTGNGRVFARLDRMSDVIVRSNVHTCQDTSLVIRNIGVSAPMFMAQETISIQDTGKGGPSTRVRRGEDKGKGEART